MPRAWDDVALHASYPDPSRGEEAFICQWTSWNLCPSLDRSQCGMHRGRSPIGRFGNRINPCRQKVVPPRGRVIHVQVAGGEFLCFSPHDSFVRPKIFSAQGRVKSGRVSMHARTRQARLAVPFFFSFLFFPAFPSRSFSHAFLLATRSGVDCSGPSLLW